MVITTRLLYIIIVNIKQVFTFISMTQEEDLERIAYIAAINTALGERGMDLIEGEIENSLVETMLKMNTDYMECVNAIINLREDD